MERHDPMTTLSEFYKNEKQRFIEKCRECGFCAKTCPIVSKTKLNEIKPKAIQSAVKKFLSEGCDSEIVRTRVFSCMECFGCCQGVCPEGLDPLRIHEIIKHELRQKDPDNFPSYDTRDPNLTHRILASIQVSAAEYRRIFTATPPRQVRRVFFPGCNVYFQPEKILNALDILEQIDPEIAFVPGLDDCCGDCHIWYGDAEKADTIADELFAKIATFNPETLILWCPTCQCRFERTFAPVKRYPFEIVTLSQFVSRHLEKLPIQPTNDLHVTLHEACKSSLTGLDPQGPRPILKAMGARLTEMSCHGENAACCGSGAIEKFPEACRQMRDNRLAEAGATGADTLVTVCHFCNQLFHKAQAPQPFQVESYINLLAKALGIAREDKYRKYSHWADTDKIIDDARHCIAASPFSAEQITATITKIFVV
jgi:Fe-S oxidoreductase